MVQSFSKYFQCKITRTIAWITRMSYVPWSVTTWRDLIIYSRLYPTGGIECHLIEDMANQVVKGVSSYGNQFSWRFPGWWLSWECELVKHLLLQSFCQPCAFHQRGRSSIRFNERHYTYVTTCIICSRYIHGGRQELWNVHVRLAENTSARWSERGRRKVNRVWSRRSGYLPRAFTIQWGS